MKIELPEKFVKEPTGYPFSPVLAVEGKEIVLTSGMCCDDYDGTIPDSMEEQARNTRENIDFSLTLLHELGIDTTSNIAVVSNDYHLARAAYLWGPPNMVPVAAHMPAIFWPLTVNYYVREAFGMAEAVLLG